MEPAHLIPSEYETRKKSLMRGVREWVQVIAVALIVALPIRFFIAEPFVVNGASMDPTFSTGQFLIVDRLSYRFSAPSRGDVIVFEYPNNPDVYYIKRIVGLPGETINIKNGRVFIANAAHPKGFLLTEPYIDPSHASVDTLSVELGEHEYFVMGDNRAQSSDSRVWGALEEHFIVGRPLVRLLPINTVAAFPGQYEQ